MIWPFRGSKDAIPTFTVENTIATGSRVRGDLSGPGGFRIDGSVEGSVAADGPVVIGEGGNVDGDIRGRDITVLGRVRGDVVASGHLEIGPKGKVFGDITVQSFRMHTGGVFRGTSSMGTDEGMPAITLLGAVHDEPRGRTLPPPNGAVVPPPPMLTEPASTSTSGAMVSDVVESQQRLITSNAESLSRATGS